ncbi:MAG: hypothetical protein ABEJ69_02610 [Candidatus Nanohaloarchaea archaeon]
METRYALVAIVGITVLASGCTQLEGMIPSNTNGNNGDTTQPPPGKGLEITRFDISDSTLRPGQRAVIIVNLKNYHTKDLEILDKSIINTGLLEVNFIACKPREMKMAGNGLYPEQECKWEVTAPPKGTIGGFETKPQSVTLHLEYRSSLVSSTPLQVQFKPFSEINNTATRSVSFKNGEVKGSMSTESPASFQGRDIQVQVRPSGSGNSRVVSDYSFEYQPSDVWQNCPSSKTPVVGDEVKFSCRIVEDSEVVRNLVLTTHYKYVKEPTLNIELVNN